MSLQIETARIEPDITVVRLVGSLTAGPEGNALERFVHDLVGRGEKRLILDLCGIEKIDSAGCQYLIQCLFTARQAEGELRLASANPKIARLFNVMRLDALFPFYRTVAAASVDFELKKPT
jgi:anti-sigma B factor antagonist